MTDNNEMDKMTKMTSNKELDEFDKYAYQLADDNLLFPRATVDPKLLLLQKDVTEFVTSVILKHEMDFYTLVDKIFPTEKSKILGSTNPTIIQMITEITNKFYNKIYFDIQHCFNTSLTQLIYQMCEHADYGAHILLDKMIRLTVDIHIDVIREKLILQKNDSDLYQKSVLNQINIYLLSKNLLHILSKGEDEDGPFVNLPDGQKAFEIIIDKNINPDKYLEPKIHSDQNHDEGINSLCNRKKIVTKNTIK